MPSVIDIDDRDYRSSAPEGVSDLPVKVEIRKSPWGYYSAIRYTRKHTEVIWSPSQKLAFTRAEKRLKKYYQLKEWHDNPLVLYPDPDTHRLELPDMPKSLMLE